jgi:hypothetical protein
MEDQIEVSHAHCAFLLTFTINSDSGLLGCDTV